MTNACMRAHAGLPAVHVRDAAAARARDGGVVRRGQADGQPGPAGLALAHPGAAWQRPWQCMHALSDTQAPAEPPVAVALDCMQEAKPHQTPETMAGPCKRQRSNSVKSDSAGDGENEGQSGTSRLTQSASGTAAAAGAAEAHLHRSAAAAAEREANKCAYCSCCEHLVHHW